MSNWKIWWEAARPRTLGAALAPVMIGTALAWSQGNREWIAALAAALGATLLQIGTNFANDYFDFRKGADTPDRLGPKRMTQAGLVAPETMKKAFLLCFALVALPGLYLLTLGGWPVALVGIVSVLSGILYTGGPFALAYLGLGDVFVFVFFGLVATAGTFYVQANHLPSLAILAGIAPGLLSMAILSVNNLRDRLTDARSKKNTLVVRFGPQFARTEYLLAWAGASLMPWIIYLVTPYQAPGSLWASAVVFLAIPAIRKVLRLDADPALNPVLGETNRLLLIYSLVFSLGWLWGGLQ